MYSTSVTYIYIK